jgi:hypothetical protein
MLRHLQPRQTANDRQHPRTQERDDPEHALVRVGLLVSLFFGSFGLHSGRLVAIGI